MHRRSLASGSCGFIIRGRKHDLSESVRRLGGGTVEYVRIATRRYKEVAREN
jgi:hypothetical protein